MASGDITTPLLNPTEAPAVVVVDTNGGSTTTTREFSASELKEKAKTWVQYIRDKTTQLKKDCVVMFYALQDERTSRWSKFMPFLVLCYVLSPLDLIPDCIPVIGVVDDIIIAPALIWLAIKMIPAEVLADAKARAESEPVLLGSNWVFASLIFIVWLFCLEFAAYLILTKFFWGYDVVRSWFGGFLALVFVVMVVSFVVYVVRRVKYEKKLKEVFDRGVTEARDIIASRLPIGQAV